MNKNIFFLVVVGVLLIANVSAIATVYVQTQDDAILIEYPKIFYLKQNQDFHLRFHAFNKTDGKLLTNETTNCTLNIYSSIGEGVLRIDRLNFNTSEADDCQSCFNAHIDGGNFSDAGFYSYLIRCQTSREGGAVSVGFEVTPSGNDAPNEGEGIIFLGSLIAMLIVGGMFLYLSSSFKESPTMRLTFTSLTAIICIIVVLYSTVSLMEVFWGFDRIISSYSTFQWVFLFIVFIAFIAVLIAILFKAVDLMKIKRGLKEHE